MRTGVVKITDRSDAMGEATFRLIERGPTTSFGLDTGVYAPIWECMHLSQDDAPAMPTETQQGPEECTCLAVRQAARHITQFYDQYLVPVGLRATQYARS